MELGVGVLLEACHADGEVVVANRQLRHGVVSSFGAGRPENRSIFQIVDLDRSIRDGGPGWVAYGSRDRGRGGLAKADGSRQKKYNYQQDSHFVKPPVFWQIPLTLGLHAGIPIIALHPTI